MKHGNKTINLVQDRATPHNNVLISEFKKNPDSKVNIWYAEDQDIKIIANYPQLGTNLTNEHFKANIYGSSINWSFIKYCLTHPHERFVFVGWINTNTRLLHLLFIILRRPFNHWTDLPSSLDNMSFLKRITRWVAYKLLKFSKAKVFVVGENTKNQFIKWGFPESKLINLPIFIKAEKNLNHYNNHKAKIVKAYSIGKNNFLITAGSRLTYQKGYDLLIRGIGLLPKEILRNVSLVIVGSGEQLSKLESMISALNLVEHITIVNWLSIDEFKALIANSDLFIHPARFDSFGGTALAMMLGVPVIGSKKAGAAVERIDHGVNGFLYDPEDLEKLSGYIECMINDRGLTKKMASEAHLTALSWPPKRGVEILVDNAI